MGSRDALAVNVTPPAVGIDPLMDFLQVFEFDVEGAGVP
jgi:hypothetical protein